ncbi:MAG: ABC transporter permease [Casimicrobiaceae bacterium]
MDILVGFVEATVRVSIPLTLAAIGGLIAERAGVFNISLEGMMLSGAFAGVLCAAASGSPWLGLLFALIIGALLGLLLGLLCVTLDGNQIVVGIMLNVLILGVTSILFRLLFGLHGQTGAAPRLPIIAIPILSDIPILGRVLFRQDALTYITFVLIGVMTVVLFHTPFGIRLRAAGDQPFALDAAGVSVTKMRYIGLALSGVCAALGGAHLTLVQLSFFSDGMTQGRGFVALAAVIFGKWHPIGAFVAALLFASAEALQLRLQASGMNVPYQLLGTLPYVVTIAALAGFMGRASPPSYLGKPFIKEAN